jgi:hypothetical protein
MVNDVVAPYPYVRVGIVKSSAVRTGTEGSHSGLFQRISRSSFRVLSEIRRELAYTATISGRKIDILCKFTFPDHEMQAQENEVVRHCQPLEE